MLERSGLRFERRSSSGASLSAQTQVLLVDTLGELTMMYAAADVAFVGGSLVPVGGHNLLEPAALGVPVLTGPFQDNNREIAKLLAARGAAAVVADAAQLADALARLFADAAQRRRMGEAGILIVAANRGSVAALVELIEPALAGA
jgi:3-deoxy-D-manno-octulosonic-acid transferase